MSWTFHQTSLVLEILKQKRIGKSCHKLQLFKKYPYARGKSFLITSEPAKTIKTLNKQENINQNREGLDSIFFYNNWSGFHCSRSANSMQWYATRKRIRLGWLTLKPLQTSLYLSYFCISTDNITSHFSNHLKRYM